jgi:hypothetical protein
MIAKHAGQLQHPRLSPHFLHITSRDSTPFVLCHRKMTIRPGGDLR